MPRKIKTAFDGSPRDRAITGIHDIAFRARTKEIEGRGTVRGCEMLVGGGTSIMPRVAPALYEFVELDNGDYLRIAEAVFRIFDRQDVAAREPRPRADQGVRRQVRHRRAAQPGRGGAARASGSPNATSRSSTRCSSTTSARARPPRPQSYGSPNGDLREFERFRAANVREQQQEGFVTVEAKVTRGDLTPEQFRGLAAIMRHYAGGYARTTVQQNLVLRWVREESVYDVWRALSELGLGEAGSREITDVVSCPGTDSCKLGITSSMGLNQAVQERIVAMDITDELTRKLNVKICGCPNGCGQHHVASSASPARRSKSASTRSPPTSRTSAACSKAAR